jgi:cell division protein FtsQ
VRSLSAALGWAPAGRPALAGMPAPVRPPRVLLRGERSRRGPLRLPVAFGRPAPRGLGLALAALMLLSVATVGAVRGGQYQAFAQRQGGVADFVARLFGFGVDVVTISGASQLGEREILGIAGVSPTNSLPFFDVAAARARLEATPLVSHASVRKLYPDQIVIALSERTPTAVWQKDGQVRAIAADGAPIDDVRDARYADLPFVVGEGANARLAEFLTLLDAAAELRPRIAAGVLIGERRWNLKMKSGLDVKLPETDPLGAIATLLRLQRQSRILERDVLSLDFRVPGRVFARLGEDAVAARAETHAKKAAAQ